MKFANFYFCGISNISDLLIKKSHVSITNLHPAGCRFSGSSKEKKHQFENHSELVILAYSLGVCL